ncbi:Halotolerance protein 9 [Rhypophila sp. PSN 637]
MAVVAPPPFKSKRDIWGSGDSAIYPPASPVPMTDIMSYQYPPPPNGADMELPSSGYLPNYPVSQQGASGMDMRPSPESGMSSRNRSTSFSKSMDLKRSVSNPAGSLQSQSQSQQPQTPHQATTPEQNALAQEKRRNKLGYHRTSVACGHCRRRKIRCMPSPNDVQGRCMQCIRLKKECSFYPVDQQPPQDTRQKSASRSSVGPKLASASSSPAMPPTGHPAELHALQTYPQLTMPSIQNMPPPMKPAGSESYPPDSKVPSSASSSRPYEYGNHGITNWMSETSPSSSKPSDLNATWRSYPTESPITPAFSPYTPHAPPPSATWSTSMASEPTSRDDIAWSTYPAPPPRSLSFGGESMSNHQQYPSVSHMSSHSGRAYDRKSSSMSADMYPPPIATTIPGIETVPGTTLEHQVSLSAGAIPPSNYGSWQQSYSYSKPGDGYAGWYGEAGAQQHLGSAEAHPEHQQYYER